MESRSIGTELELDEIDNNYSGDESDLRTLEDGVGKGISDASSLPSTSQVVLLSNIFPITLSNPASPPATSDLPSTRDIMIDSPSSSGY